MTYYIKTAKYINEHLVYSVSTGFFYIYLECRNFHERYQLLPIMELHLIQCGSLEQPSAIFVDHNLDLLMF